MISKNQAEDQRSGTGQSFNMRPSGHRPEEEEPELLDEDELVDLEAEKRDSNTTEILERLDRELVGLKPIKQRISEIAALLLVDRLRNRFGLTSTRPTLHMSFTGAPGTGKTTVAVRMAELLHGLGYLRKGHLVRVTRDDLVGQYVGHTAPKTKEVIKRAMGGVLFIDEAYYLYREDNERDYGQETVEILLQMMEDEREDLVVILAGYKDRMDSFFRSNPGMGSRIAHHLDFPEFTVDELVQIGDLLLEEENYELAEDAREVFREYLERRMEQPRFSNARSVRNALERARLRQASRLLDSDNAKVGKKDLVVLKSEDFIKSRVFTDSAGREFAEEDGDEDGGGRQT